MSGLKRWLTPTKSSNKRDSLTEASSSAVLGERERAPRSLPIGLSFSGVDGDADHSNDSESTTSSEWDLSDADLQTLRRFQKTMRSRILLRKWWRLG